MERRRDEVLALIRSGARGALRTAVDAAKEPRARRSRRGRAGIHRLAVPTPFMVGRVNAYLIEDSPLTLVDSGPNSAKALDELEQALAARGTRSRTSSCWSSPTSTWTTSACSILARRSGAEVAALDSLAPFLADYGQQTDLDDQYAEGVMLRHGIPDGHRTALLAVLGRLSRLGRSAWR